MKSKVEVEIEGKRLELSNLDKVLYPESGFTKGHVLDYYRRIAPALLPHLKDRPLTLKRYPEGVDKEHFYEKRCPPFRPAWVKTAAIQGREKEILYCEVNNLASFIWAGNLADLELHTSLSRHQNPERPTMMVFDLDPGPPADVLDCAEVALELRRIFNKHKLECFPKTTGSKGLQVYVPLNTAVTYDDTKTFARDLAVQLAHEHPDKIVYEMKKTLRQNKIFVDWSQNDRHKTTVCVYSLRAKARPTVSTPVTWEEVTKALKTKRADCLVFETEDVLTRVEGHGDLFEPVLKLKQKLP